MTISCTNSGDGIQINAAIEQHAASTHHLYIGRNVSHDNSRPDSGEAGDRRHLLAERIRIIGRAIPRPASAWASNTR
jgi:hypothetical protein